MKKNRLPENWYVKNDGSQLFQDTVIKYLNDNYDESLKGYGAYYGREQYKTCVHRDDADFDGYPLLLTIEAFIEMTEEKECKFNQELITQLSEGKIAVKNDGTLKELRDVLKEAFPNERYQPSGGGGNYGLYQNHRWVGMSDIEPVKSVKDFFITQPSEEREPEFKEGDIVEVTQDRAYYKWITETFAFKGEKGYFCYINSNKYEVKFWPHCRLPQPKEVTTEEAEKILADHFKVSTVKIV